MEIIRAGMNLKLLIKFKYFTSGSACNVERNSDYFGNKAKIAGVSIVIVPEDTQPQALATGQLDLINPSANPDNTSAMEAGGKAKAVAFVGNGYNLIGLNFNDPALSDKRVRQALYYGMDFATFIKNEWKGYAEKCITPISSVSWAYSDKKELNNYDFNPEKAKSLLEEAGWKLGANGIREKDGKKLELLISIYNDTAWPQNLVAMATEQWKAIGVDLKVELYDFNTVMDKAMKLECTMWTQGWSLSIDPDPTGIFDKASIGNGGYNMGSYVNEDAEKLFKDGRMEFDQKKRSDIYKQWAKIANDDLPYLFCANRQQLWGVANTVKGLDKMGPYYDWTQCLDEVTISK